MTVQQCCVAAIMRNSGYTIPISTIRAHLTRLCASAPAPAPGGKGNVRGWVSCPLNRPGALAVKEPSLAVDLKTGFGFISNAQAAKYYRNLPANTQLIQLNVYGIGTPQ
jgi:hypothetical protein